MPHPLATLKQLTMQDMEVLADEMRYELSREPEARLGEYRTLDLQQEYEELLIVMAEYKARGY
tara:strand:- start:182 stop:370 length:189 start_codon:yes stop_codon:yes gene_type:complete